MSVWIFRGYCDAAFRPDGNCISKQIVADSLLNGNHAFNGSLLIVNAIYEQINITCWGDQLMIVFSLALH